MTTLYWNGSAFAPVNKTAAKKEAALLRLEAAFMGADAIPSQKHRGLMYLRQNGFVATSCISQRSLWRRWFVLWELLSEHQIHLMFVRD